MKNCLLLLLIPVLMLAGCDTGKDVYSVVLTDDGNGTAKATVGGTEVAEAAEGTEIFLTATPAGGYVFDRWTAENGGVILSNASAARTKFIMPAENVAIKAEFKPVEYYAITIIDGSKGTTVATVGGEEVTGAAAGSTVTLAATPDEGYSFNRWTVVEGGVSLISGETAADKTFVMPACDVVVEAVFIEESDFDIFTRITDTAFREYCRQFDTDKDTKLSFREADKVTYMNASGLGIAALDGIGYFKKLRELHCTGNNLASIDMSKNPALFRLYCGGNDLGSLDISGCAKLERLGCNDTGLTSIELSGCAALAYIECANNQLSAIDLSECPVLKSLRCGNNRLGELDLSNNPMLFELFCNTNRLTELDISKNKALYQLSCFDNRMSELDITDMTTYPMYETYDVWCGAQTKDGTSAQKLTLTMREDQKYRWESTLAGNPANIDVILAN
jgi:Leucine-rich repeat (LRR) protein